MSRGGETSVDFRLVDNRVVVEISREGEVASLAWEMPRPTAGPAHALGNLGNAFLRHTV